MDDLGIRRTIMAMCSVHPEKIDLYNLNWWSYKYFCGLIWGFGGIGELILDSLMIRWNWITDDIGNRRTDIIKRLTLSKLRQAQYVWPLYKYNSVLVDRNIYIMNTRTTRLYLYYCHSNARHTRSSQSLIERRF